MVKRNLVRSCCGSKGYILELDAPITKQTLTAFKEAGYKTAEHYTRVGVFYAHKDGITANGPFGGMRIHVRCGSANCSKLLDSLENTFKVANLAQDQNKT